MSDPYQDDPDDGPPPHRSGLSPRARELVRDASRATAREIAAQEARDKLYEAFMSFGVDLADDRSRREFFEDMIYVRNMRVRGRRLGMLIVGGIIAALTGLISTFIPSWLHR